MYPSSCHVLKAISYVSSAKQAASFIAMPVKLLSMCDGTEAALPQMLELPQALSHNFA